MKLKKMKKFLFGSLFVALLGLASCSLFQNDDDKAYSQAKKSDSIERYLDYLDLYAKGAHVDKVNARMAELDEVYYQEAIKTNTLDGYDKYGKYFSQGKHIAEINDKVIDLLKPEQILVEGGTFQMGNNKKEAEDNMAHQVRVNSFKIDKFEVSQAEFYKIMGKNPSFFKGPSLPVTNICWQDAFDYATKVGKRLPTEAEWEYAAKGGKKSGKTTYSGGEDPVVVAWINKSSGGKLQRIGTKKANELGIYDMSGNASEWVNDWYAEFTKQSWDNPQGPKKSSFKTIRGGSFNDHKKYASTTYRTYNKNIPEAQNKFTGFRCAADAK
jgi:formylglycine-generating enzyme required for sulfatase activity